MKFYNTDLLHTEITKHRNKLLALSKLMPTQLEIATRVFSKRINFIDARIIPCKILNSAEKLMQYCDKDDIEFVALTNYLKGKLWTGDKRLINCLGNAKWNRVMSISEISDSDL